MKQILMFKSTEILKRTIVEVMVTGGSGRDLFFEVALIPAFVKNMKIAAECPPTLLNQT
jgi:hypothetical protein